MGLHVEFQTFRGMNPEDAVMAALREPSGWQKTFKNSVHALECFTTEEDMQHFLIRFAEETDLILPDIVSVWNNMEKHKLCKGPRGYAMAAELLREPTRIRQERWEKLRPIIARALADSPDM